MRDPRWPHEPCGTTLADCPHNKAQHRAYAAWVTPLHAPVESTCYWDAALTETICPKHGKPIGECPVDPHTVITGGIIEGPEITVYGGQQDSMPAPAGGTAEPAPWNESSLATEQWRP